VRAVIGKPRAAALFSTPMRCAAASGIFAQIADCASISESVLHPVTVIAGSNCRGLCAIVGLEAVIKIGGNKVNADAWD
jgi:hypothetical protein